MIADRRILTAGTDTDTGADTRHEISCISVLEIRRKSNFATTSKKSEVNGLEIFRYRNDLALVLKDWDYHCTGSSKIVALDQVSDFNSHLS